MVNKYCLYFCATIAMLYVNVTCISVLSAQDKSAMIEACVREELVKMKSPQNFTDAEKGCESGSTDWKGQADHCSTTVCFEAPAGRTITSASVENVSAHGEASIGPVRYITDNTGRTSQVCVDVGAQSPGGMNHVGEHGWQKIKLHGVHEAYLSQEAIIQATLRCVEKYR